MTNIIERIAKESEPPLPQEVIDDLIKAARKISDLDEGDEKIEFALINVFDRHPQFEAQITNFILNLQPPEETGNL